MTLLTALAAGVIILLSVGWWLSWLATRLDRAHGRVERSWAALDVALVRRAQRAADVARESGVDPATTLLVCDAAAVALEIDLAHEEREQAESALSHVLGLVALSGLEQEQDRAVLARRLYNDAVSTARALRDRPIVRTFRLAGHAVEPKPFEMADDQQLVWSGGQAW